MSLEIIQHAEFTSGPLHNFGFERVQFQTKVILGNMLKNFFDRKVQSIKLTMPSILHYQNTASDIKLSIRRDFPFFERQIPFIATTIVSSQMKPSSIGTDDFLYSEIYSDVNGDVYEEDMCAGMRDLTTSLVVAARSAEDRMDLIDLVTMCFNHYFKWVYHYKGVDGSYFNFIPSTKLVVQGGEAEVTDESKTSLIYIADITLTPFVEYIFKDVGIEWQAARLEEIDTSGGALKP